MPYLTRCMRRTLTVHVQTDMAQPFPGLSVFLPQRDQGHLQQCLAEHGKGQCRVSKSSQANCANGAGKATAIQPQRNQRQSLHRMKSDEMSRPQVSCDPRPTEERDGRRSFRVKANKVTPVYAEISCCNQGQQKGQQEP